MPVPIPPPINDLTDDNTRIELDMLPTINTEDLYQTHSPMEFTPRDFPDSFNLQLPSPQNSLSTVSENASESEA